jgi:hypothetical protein
MQPMYTRGGKHIGTIWSRVTCLDSLLVAAQTPTHRVLGSSQDRRLLTIATGNKQYKKININNTPNSI